MPEINIKKPDTLKFDNQKFEIEVKKGLYQEGRTLKSAGFAAVIIKNGNIVHEVAGGWAVVKDEVIAGFGPVTKSEMTTATPTNIGSCMKLVSFISLLGQLERMVPVDPNNLARNFDWFLHSRILRYLPFPWRRFIETHKDPEVRREMGIGFHHLLRHQSGYRTSALKKTVFDYIRGGVAKSDFEVREYHNMNGGILSYLLPRLLEDPAAEVLEEKLRAGKVADDDSATYGKLYGQFFERWMQENVFNVITPRIQPSCDPWVEYHETRTPAIPFAISYDGPAGGNPGWYSESVTKGGVHAQGGYHMSMRELAAFMANFQASDILVSPQLRQRMYDDTTEASRDARLGWNKLLQSGFATKHFGVNSIPYHGGTSLSYRTAVVQLPGGYIAMGSVNGIAPGLESADVATSLKNGWAAALAANFE